MDRLLEAAAGAAGGLAPPVPYRQDPATGDHRTDVKDGAVLASSGGPG